MPLLGKRGSKAILVGEPQCHQLLIAVQLLGNGSLTDPDTPCHQLPVNLRHALVLREAQATYECDDVEAELAVGQGVSTFLLGAVRLVVALALRIPAAAHQQDQT